MPVFVGDIKIADLLPESKAADQGKVLNVSETGEPSWKDIMWTGTIDDLPEDQQNGVLYLVYE